MAFRFRLAHDYNEIGLIVIEFILTLESITELSSGIIDMRFEHNHSMQDYFTSADENASVLLKAGAEFRSVADDIYKYFLDVFFSGESDLKGTSALLAANAFTLWLASVRVAASGHAAAAYPLFRVALESACYCFLTQRNEAIETIWRQRDENAGAARLCRKTMTGAVKDVTAMFNAEQQGSGDDIYAAYESAIDFGAHPNVKSIFLNVEVADVSDADLTRVALISVGGSASREVRRTLVAALEYGIIVCLILLRAVPGVSQLQADSLGQLIATKDKLVWEWFEFE